MVDLHIDICINIKTNPEVLEIVEHPGFKRICEAVGFGLCRNRAMAKKNGCEKKTIYDKPVHISLHMDYF
jgi:hypothetical protein